MRDHDPSDSERLAWREHGPADGALVVLLHGLGGSRTAWDPQLRALGEAGYRAVAWDMPGYGASPAPATPLTFGFLADAVADLVARLGVEQAHVVGLSMGGMVALHTAIAHPGRVRSLGLLDTSPAFGLDGTTTAEGWMRARLAPLAAGETPATMAHRVIRAIMGPHATSAAVAEACAAMARIPAAGLADAVRCLPTHDVRDRLGEIHCPARVLVGELDEETPPGYAEHLAAHLPRAELQVLPGVGHLSNLEDPAAVNDALRSFLASVP